MDMSFSGSELLFDKLKQVEKELKIESDELVKDLAKQVAKELAQKTEPRGLTNKAKKTSENVVSGDVYRSVKTYGRIVNELKTINPKAAAIMAEYLNKGKIDKAQRVAAKYLPIDKFTQTFSESEHNKNRDKRGRVKKNNEADGTSDRQGMFGYIGKAIKVIGLAKAGWLASGDQVKSSKAKRNLIPAWLRSDKTLGNGTTQGSNTSLVITLINKCSYAANILSQRNIKQAMDAAYRVTYKRFDKMLEHAAKKFNK